MNMRIQLGKELKPKDRLLLQQRHSPVATIGISVLDKGQDRCDKGVPLDNQHFQKYRKSSLPEVRTIMQKQANIH